MSEIHPKLCDACMNKYRGCAPLTVEMKFVFSNVPDEYGYSCNIPQCYCIHKFREIKLTETNLELLERKYEENLDK